MSVPASDHFNGKTFFQPGAQTARTFWDFLKWRFTRHATKWPQHVELAPQPPPPTPHGNEMVVTWLGHATFLVQTSAGNVLFDPVFSERVSPFRRIGPRRVHPVPFGLEALPHIDAVFVSHDHYDHCDAPTLRALASRNPEAVFIAPLRHRDLLQSAGARQIVELDWWQSHPIAPGLTLTLTPTKHWSNRLGRPRNYRLWGGAWMEFSIFDSRFSIADRHERGDHASQQHASAGSGEQKLGLASSDSRFSTAQTPKGSGGDLSARHASVGAAPTGDPDAGAVSSSQAGPIETRESKIETQPRRLWFVGDSGFDEGLFQSIRERCGSPDVALVPIGAYEPRWFMAPMHINPDEAVKLHQDIGARLSLAMHWGTFQLTDEGREEPVRALTQARAAHDVGAEQFRVIDPGQSVIV